MINPMLKYFLILTVMIYLASVGVIPSGASPDTISGFDIEYFQYECRHVREVLPDLVPGRHWIVMENSGLALLDEPSPGNLRFTYFNIPMIDYGAGPDSSGNIYLTTFETGMGYGIKIFNCRTLSVGEFHPLDDFRISDIDISPDGSKLYVAASLWPVSGESYSPGEYHPDSGLVLEVDKETFEITRRVSIGQEPETIFVSANDMVYVDTSQEVTISTASSESFHGCYRPPTGSLTDSVNTNTFERSQRFACGEGSGNFIRWSDDGSRFAQCNAGLSLIPTRPEYDCGLWIFDSELNAVVQPIKVIDDAENLYGVYCGTASKVRDGVAYVRVVDPQTFWSSGSNSTHPYNLLAIDMESGEYIAGAMLDFGAHYIYEIDDGTLVVFGPSNIIALVKPIS